MDKNQYTPGPWLAGQSITAAKPDRAAGSYERTTIAQRVNRAADAWLIAAAPDMLAALQRLLEYTGGWDLTDPDHPIVQARAAIAKARGEAPR